MPRQLRCDRTFRLRLQSWLLDILECDFGYEAPNQAAPKQAVPKQAAPRAMKSARPPEVEHLLRS